MLPADFIATCAGVVSFCSFVVSVRALKIQRDHDKKSVQPIPQIIFGDYENSLHVAIENAGIGPFILEEIRVRSSLSNLVKSSIVAHLQPLPDGFFWSEVVEKIQTRAISAQKRLVLLRLDEPDTPDGFDEVRKDVRTRLGYLTVELAGTDIYGEKRLSCSRSLNHFHRTLFGTENEPKRAQ